MFIRADFELCIWIYILLLTGSLPSISCRGDVSRIPCRYLNLRTVESLIEKGAVFAYIPCICAQPCVTLGKSMHCSPPGSSVHGIFQAWILELVAISSSRGSSWPRDQTCISCIAGGFFTTGATREAHITLAHPLINFKSSLDYLYTQGNVSLCK